MQPLDSVGETEWQRIRQHLILTEGFALGYCFTQHDQVLQQLRERVIAHYRAEPIQVDTPQISQPEDLVEKLVPWLLQTPEERTTAAKPIWLDLNKTPPDQAIAQAWKVARRNFIMRLNERRDPLRNRLGVPLIMIFPVAEKSDIRAFAPDLWSIRSFVLQTENWLPLPAAKAPELPTPPPIEPLNRYQNILLTEWKRLRDGDKRTHETFIAADQAFEAVAEQGQLTQATAIATWMHQTAQHLIQQQGEIPETLRDLSNSLEKIGQTQTMQGDWPAAQQTYTDALQIRRDLLNRLGETPETLSELSNCLGKIGNTQQALGNWQTAQKTYTEALQIRQKQLHQFGETPEALSELSATLNKIGRTEEMREDWSTAQQTYTDALQINHKLMDQLGKTPQILNDLSTTLSNIGRVQHTLGNLQDAQKTYTNALAAIQWIKTHKGPIKIR